MVNEPAGTVKNSQLACVSQLVCGVQRRIEKKILKSHLGSVGTITVIILWPVIDRRLEIGVMYAINLPFLLNNPGSNYQKCCPINVHPVTYFLKHMCQSMASCISSDKKCKKLQKQFDLTRPHLGSFQVASSPVLYLIILSQKKSSFIILFFGLSYSFFNSEFQ